MELEAKLRNVIPEKISGATLKWIALITMLIDHISCCLIEVYLMNGFGTSTFTGFKSFPLETRYAIYILDRVLRGIGRLAFPIFCFLLVEGFLHTKDLKKYAGRLLIFGLLSEIPGDLAIQGSYFTLEYQNVYWTLLVGLLSVAAMDYFEKSGKAVLGIITTLACFGIAEVTHMDYGWGGVMLIWFFYLGRRSRFLQVALIAVWCLLYGGIEVWGIVSIIPILLYNGERGHQPKYLFYAFYPVHLMVLALIGRYLLPILLG